MMKAGAVGGLFLVATVLSMPTVRQNMGPVSAELIPRLTASARQTVAVVDFTDLQGEATELGRFLAEELSVALASSASALTVIDRTHLKAILKEHQLAASGLIDPQTARQLGKLAGVDTLVTGTLTPFGDSVRLTVKALDAETAAMIAATTADIPRTGAITELLGRSVAGPRTGDASGPPSPGRTSGPPTENRLELGGLNWELIGCTASGECRIILVSDRDTSVQLLVPFDPGLRAWDQTGREFRPSQTLIGNRNATLGAGADVVAGVRTAVTLTFEFPSDRSVTEVSALQLAYSTVVNGERRTFSGRFRNVPVR